MKQWKQHPAISKKETDAFPELHPVALQLLYNRGLHAQEQIDAFLDPQYDRDVLDPFLFTQMQRAVDRVFLAIEDGESIMIHGDYDADGICGASLLMDAFVTLQDAMKRKITAQAFLPDREKDGYGYQKATAERFVQQDVKLVITVDCGISNHEAIDWSFDQGVNTIVCDHHSIPERLPAHAIIIHPKVDGETYPNKSLCGTGVAWKLACGLFARARERGFDILEGTEKWLLDLVAIATVTDVMPILGENRVLEKYGLVVLNKTKRPGLRALIESAGIGDKILNTWNIGFQIGPRINAAGRIAHAKEAMEVLTEKDPLVAQIKATQLNVRNTERRTISDQSYKEALVHIGNPGNASIIFVAHAQWNAGVVGLMAGKLVNDFARPVYVATQVNGMWVGSGRSIVGFDVTHALSMAKDYLVKFGGHPEACGFTIDGEENLEEVKRILEDHAARSLSKEQLAPTLLIEQELTVDQIDWTLYDVLEQFEPFGQANVTPIFSSHGVQVVGIDTVGKTATHLRLRVSQNGKQFKCIAFGMGELVEKIHVGDSIDIAYNVTVNEWNGNRELQLNIIDIHV